MENFPRLPEFDKKSAHAEKKGPTLFHYSHLGLQFALTILIFFALGYYAEREWNFHPWGTIAGMLLGFAIALYHLLRSAKNMEREMSDENKE